MKEDRQLRQWLCILYPDDNVSHQDALGMVEKILDYDYVMLYHIPIINQQDELIKKGHVHLVMWFDKPMRKSTLIKRLGLSIESDAHLFKGLDELRNGKNERMFMSIDNYIDYLSHNGNMDKPDKYIFDDFTTNVPDRVMKALNKTVRTKAEYFIELVDFFNATCKLNKDTIFWGLNEWFTYAYKKGLGDVVYSNWNKFKDLVQDYKIR